MTSNNGGMKMTSNNGQGLKELTLTVTESCNQRCKYCYVPLNRGRQMDFDVARAAVDLFFEHARSEGTLTIAFFGGEPFLAVDLMRRVAEYALSVASDPGRIQFAVTTNGTAIDDAGWAFIDEFDMRVAVSYDGDRGQAFRPLAQGGSSRHRFNRNLPKLLTASAGKQDGRSLARMTVTPDNVAHLADNVRSTFRAGFERILFLPDIEVDWDPAALRQWRRQQERLLTWFVGRQGAGRPIPDLMAWTGVLSRLSGARRGHCGAGVSQVAASPDGTFYACYRAVYDPHDEDIQLGNVTEGFTHPERWARYAELDPNRVRPETGDCATCSARDGCGFFCPAQGHLATGDLASVPAVVCELTRIQVDVCRRLVRSAKPTKRRSRFAVAAAAAAAVLGTSLAVGAGCDRGVGTGGNQDAGPDGSAAGLCPVFVDGGHDGTVDGEVDSGYLPGLCAIYPDADVDSGYSPGLCPQPMDGGEPDGPPPGLC